MPHSNNLSYEFGPYRLDLSKRVLTRGGEVISLAPKATEILVMLVLNAGQLVEKDELLKEVWPNSFVEEANLSQNVFTLRRALGDERADPRYIETVVRRGYRFIGTVRTVSGHEKEVEDSQPVAGASVASRLVVAVLPFLNATGDPDVEYLADGLTSNIINNLSRVSKLRVMSRSMVFRYTTRALDPQQAGRDLGAKVVLVGKISSRFSGIAVDVELVDAATGWQLWGESFDSESTNLLEIQDAITRQLLATLQLTLSGEEEKRVTARYTESSEAYQSYLEGRFHWSRYTRKGIEKAIGHFQRAIKIDPNYALAYAGIVDCYLRLATNYLPPEDENPSSSGADVPSLPTDESDPRLKLRFEWDWKGAERELRRANELKTDYPRAHQWYAAYRFSERLYEEACISKRKQYSSTSSEWHSHGLMPAQIVSPQLTPTEQFQVYCAIAREQIDVGNYDAACKMLQPRWVFGNWPKTDGLSPQCCADLLFTSGELAGAVASTRLLPKGQKHAEALLNRSIALFEQLGSTRRAAEGSIELALCHYRQGFFDLGRLTLSRVLDDLSKEDWELRSLALIRLASLERHAGRLTNALTHLNEASTAVESAGPWATGRCHLELASTYKDLAISGDDVRYFDNAKYFYFKALYEFEAVGHHRYVAAVGNNMGFLLLSLGCYEDSERHLLRSRTLFECLSDSVRRAQVNETLAQLYIQTRQHKLAQETIQQAVESLELTDAEALLAEALTTRGVLESRLQQYTAARRSFWGACQLAERCGDTEGASRTLLAMLEEMGGRLGKIERNQVSEKLNSLLVTSTQTALLARVHKLFSTIIRGGKETD